MNGEASEKHQGDLYSIVVIHDYLKNISLPFIFIAIKEKEQNTTLALTICTCRIHTKC